MKRSFMLRMGVFGLLIVSSGLAIGQISSSVTPCGSLENAYGPYDYRTHHHKLEIVERFHFDAGVETLTKSKGSKFGGDLDYTLRTSPNHHRALMTLVKLVMREKTVKPKGSRYTIDCWFNRAERFRPDDAMVKTIYGLYLVQSGQARAGAEKLEAARKVDAANANVHYNLGLAYVELKQFDKALESAHAAYRMGFPLPGLREKLRRVGQWRELSQGKGNATASPDGRVQTGGGNGEQPLPEPVSESPGPKSE